MTNWTQRAITSANWKILVVGVAILAAQAVFLPLANKARKSSVSSQHRILKMSYVGAAQAYPLLRIAVKVSPMPYQDVS